MRYTLASNGGVAKRRSSGEMTLSCQPGISGGLNTQPTLPRDTAPTPRGGTRRRR